MTIEIRKCLNIASLDLCSFINDSCPSQAALSREDQFETLSKTVYVYIKLLSFFCQEMSREEIWQELIKEEYRANYCASSKDVNNTDDWCHVHNVKQSK